MKLDVVPEAVANPAQLKQKKARLADNLNEKILHRPGPLELVQKNILPLNSTVKHAMKAGRIHLAQTPDGFAVEDNDSSSSNNTVLAGQPGDRQSTAYSSPQPADETAVTSCAPLQSPTGLLQRMELKISIPESEAKGVASNGQIVPILAIPAPATGPQRPAEPGKPQRQKRPKDARPKVKKLKYHQYIPPDQKADKGPVAMDTAYSRLLQQQQIFLQLQILNQQQQQSISFQTIQSGPPRLTPEQIINFATAVPAQVPCVPFVPFSKSCQTMPSAANTKPELLPANLDDLTVSELRQQLRKRGLPVSGTKPALLERLKPYQILSPKLAPPSLAGSPLAGPLFEAAEPARGDPRPSPAAEPTAPNEDVTLVEKEKVIERLTRKLQQEQRQAEGLRVELELRKRRHPQTPEAPGLPAEAPPAPGLLPARPFSSLGLAGLQAVQRAFGRPGAALETSRPGSPVALSYGRGPAQASSAAAAACDPEALRRSPSPSNPYFSSSSSIRANKAIGVIGHCCPPCQQEPLSSCSPQGHSGLSQSHSIQDILEEHLMRTELSPSLDGGLANSPAASLPSCPASPDYLREAGERSEARGPCLPPYEDFGAPEVLTEPFLPGRGEPSCPPPDRRGDPGGAELGGMAFDPADWMEALPGSPAAGTPGSPSVFSTDFTEPPDLNINRMIDLLVEQW
ncbi:myocardin-like [Heterodontus francisci]|uniref:myocardin-like n=1 Tax=Heterodontus francisci TaxID=7792 RepID=UPI00355BB22E